MATNDTKSPVRHGALKSRSALETGLTHQAKLRRSSHLDNEKFELAPDFSDSRTTPACFLQPDIIGDCSCPRSVHPSVPARHDAMSESNVPLLERGFSNLLVTGILYPMTCLPFMPLTGIYQTGKLVFEQLKDTPLGKTPTAHITATAVITPVIMIPLMVPLGLAQGLTFVSDNVAKHGIDKGVENLIGKITGVVRTTAGSALNRGN